VAAVLRFSDSDLSAKELIRTLFPPPLPVALAKRDNFLVSLSPGL
jgi:hypothetical protein